MNDQKNPIEFNLEQVNVIKPKQIRDLNIINLIRSNNIPGIKSALYDLSHENFKENDYIEMNNDEIKLTQAYQIIMQYMMKSIDQLEEKNKTLMEFIDKQIDYNEEAEKVVEKQNKKIKNQKKEIEEIKENCKNMEFLIGKLGLEERIKELGIKAIKDEDNII